MNEVQPGTVSFWIELLVAFFLIAGGLITLIGTVGLLRLRSFFQRIHGPTMGNTTGAICILNASMLYFSVKAGKPQLHEVLITLFLLMTTPVTNMLLARAALHRQRSAAMIASLQQQGRASRIAAAQTQTAPQSDAPADPIPDPPEAGPTDPRA